MQGNREYLVFSRLFSHFQSCPVKGLGPQGRGQAFEDENKDVNLRYNLRGLIQHAFTFKETVSKTTFDTVMASSRPKFKEVNSVVAIKGSKQHITMV